MRVISPNASRFRVSGRRAGQRFDAEHGTATEALLFLGDLDPEAIGPNIARATHYEPTPIGELERLLASVPFALDGATFVDLGSGMGRAVLVAAGYPFRQVVGVEISPALHAIARDNLVAFGREALRCRDVRLVRRDATRYAFPTGDLVVYLYNPFDATLVERIVETLRARPAGRCALLYHTPVARSVVEASGAFSIAREEPFGVAYVRIAP